MQVTLKLWAEVCVNGAWHHVGYKTHDAYRSHNPDLMCILTGLHNQARCAALPQAGMAPIHDGLRGVPEGASRATWAQTEHPDADGTYGWSHYTLAELLAYDWDRRTVYCGALPFETWVQEWAASQARQLRHKPCAYHRPTKHTLQELDMLELVQCYKRQPVGQRPQYLKMNAKTDGLAVWETTPRQAAQEFLTQVLPWLHSLAEKAGGADQVRVIFRLD